MGGKMSKPAGGKEGGGFFSNMFGKKPNKQDGDGPGNGALTKDKPDGDGPGNGALTKDKPDGDGPGNGALAKDKPKDGESTGSWIKRTSDDMGPGAKMMLTGALVMTGLYFLPGVFTDAIANSVFGFLPEEYRKPATAGCSSFISCSSCVMSVMVIVMAFTTRG